MLIKFLFAITISVFFLPFELQAQQPAAIKNLVFEGAGIRGLAYAGVIEELETRKMINQVERVGGTSAGAITALAVCLGYTSEEITALISGTNFQMFNDGKFFFVGGINRMNKYFGWYRGKKFSKWIGKLIDQKTGNADITFEELHHRGFKDLYVTATCLNKQQMIILSHETFPKMRVKDAIRISISIPLYYEPVFLDAVGNVIYHPREKKGLDVMVDGGFIGNFPIKIFDSTRYTPAHLSQNTFSVNPATLGFRIDRDEQINYDKKEKTLAPMQITSLREYTGAFYNIIIENLNRQTLSDKDWERTVSISDGRIGPRIRKLSKKEIAVLLENGRAAAKKYINKF